MMKIRSKIVAGAAKDTGASFVRQLVVRYRLLKRKLDNALAREDRDYSRLTALSQELARFRQKVRDELLKRKGAKQALSDARERKASHSRKLPLTTP